MKKGAELVLKTVQAIEKNNYPSIPQTESNEVKHAPKIFKETCEISWNRTSEEVRNFVRGLSPYPGAWTTLGGKTYKVFKVSVVQSESSESSDHFKWSDDSPGKFSTDNKNYLRVKTSDGWVELEEFQAEGKKRMQAQEFFRGNRLSNEIMNNE